MLFTLPSSFYYDIYGKVSHTHLEHQIVLGHNTDDEFVNLHDIRTVHTHNNYQKPSASIAVKALPAM